MQALLAQPDLGPSLLSEAYTIVNSERFNLYPQLRQPVMQRSMRLRLQTLT